MSITIDEDAARTLATLVETYGFPVESALEAMTRASDATDVAQIVEILLEDGHADRGGPALGVLETCPHAERGDLVETSVMSRGMPTSCGSCDEKKELWSCLSCGVVGCGRYSKERHASEHNERAEGETHSLAMSWEDLSVWCYSCGSYLAATEGKLGELVKAARRAKFGETSA
jgi:uncharacterized UBP type Zn finger protein